MASLDRGDNFPKLVAMSGYSEPRSGHANVIQNSSWTEVANNLRARCGLETVQVIRVACRKSNPCHTCGETWLAENAFSFDMDYRATAYGAETNN
jgi:hypothetical protein